MAHGQLGRTRIIIGSDHRGREILSLISGFLCHWDQYELVFVNTCDEAPVDYPDIAAQVAQEISLGNAEWGILICGTGVGMCVVANKFPGVRAAPCHNEVAAELSRQHNDANVLCLSGDLLGERSTLSVIEKWLTTKFMGGRHQDRLEKIRTLEKKLYASNPK